MLGLAGAVDRALDAVAKEVQGELTVYITGGDALVLSAWLETETQFRANLVLEGLAFIAAESCSEDESFAWRHKVPSWVIRVVHRRTTA